MKRARSFVVTMLASSMLVGVADAGEDGLGLYGRGGVALGWANVDDDFVGATVSNGINVGFNIAGGYRFSPLLDPPLQGTQLASFVGTRILASQP